MRVRWFASEKRRLYATLYWLQGIKQKIIPDRMPIPRIQDVLKGLGGHKYFSTLDIPKAYYQGFMHENSHHLTAFTSPWGLYEWLRILLGFVNITTSFSTIYQPMFVRTERFDMHTVPWAYFMLWKNFWPTLRKFENCIW